MLSKTTNPRVEKHPTQAFLCIVDNLLPPDWLIVSCDRSGQYRIWRVLFHPRLPWPSKQICLPPPPCVPRKLSLLHPLPRLVLLLTPPPTCTLLRQQTLLCCSSPNLTLQPAKLSFLLLLLLYCRRSSFKIHAEIYYNYRIYV